MKLLFASKYYYRRGGLEAYLFKAKQLLEESGHVVVPFSTNYVENIESSYSKRFCKYYDISKINKKDVFTNFKILKNMFNNSEAYDGVKKLCAEESPQILQGFGVTKHLSPSIFRAAKDSGVKTVMRLSDYALMCPNSVALDGNLNVCDEFDCVTKNNLRCIKTKCVKGSTVASVVGYFEVKINIMFGNYKKYVDHWIAPSQFIRTVFIKYYGIDEKDITFLPVFFDCKYAQPVYTSDDYILCAGRISREKGIGTLLKAMDKSPNIKLKLVGTGPLENNVKAEIEKRGLNIEYLGFKEFDAVKNLIKGSKFLVVPSECYENSPNIIMEAFAFGKPVIGARIGGIPEMLIDGETGYTFDPGNVDDLNEKITRLYQNSNEIISMGKNAREKMVSKWNPDRHYESLMSIYNKVIGDA